MGTGVESGDSSAPVVASSDAAVSDDDGDVLARVLRDVGVDVDAAPATVLEADGVPLCGIEHGVQGGYAGLNEQARRCFLDAHTAAQPALFIEQQPTSEGDPIVSIWRTGVDGSIVIDIDTTRDAYGPRGWEHVSCDELTTTFPGAPETPPDSYFACDDASDATGRDDAGGVGGSVADVVGISNTYVDVEFYPACGNEVLNHRGVTWYTLGDVSGRPVVPDLQSRLDRVTSIDREPSPVTSTHGLVRVAPPGPGDDNGRLVVWDDGVARWTSDSGDLDVWLTTAPIDNTWVC